MDVLTDSRKVRAGLYRVLTSWGTWRVRYAPATATDWTPAAPVELEGGADHA